jgi:hypothetical protein
VDRFILLLESFPAFSKADRSSSGQCLLGTSVCQGGALVLTGVAQVLRTPPW